jgi:predicted DNA-binding transcriptional regulator YafY
MPRQGSISETLYRHWQLLRLIPRSPRRIDAASIERHLRAEGIEVARRSIQRDLESLATSFPIECDERSKPYGWSWKSDAEALEMPPMSVRAAVTLELVRGYLTQTLPRTTLKSLDPYFARAKDVLAKSPNAKLARWPSKVRVVPRGAPLRAPAVSPRVLDVVYEALLQERRFVARYRPRGTTTLKEYDVNPLALLVRGNTLTLVCTLREYEDVRHLLLHRIASAELLDSPTRVLRGFDLDHHINQGRASFPKGSHIALKLLVDQQVALTLEETPLAADQRLTPFDDQRQGVDATVADTMELRGWLTSYGPLVEVLEPATLRATFASAAREMARLYAKRRAGSRRIARAEA